MMRQAPIARTVRRIVQHIAAGIVLTYASAWLIALTAPMGSSTHFTPDTESPPRPHLPRFCHSMGSTWFGGKWEMWFDDDFHNGLSRFSIGFPWLALRSQYATKDNVQLALGPLSEGVAIPGDERYNRDLGVPVRPLLPGFVFNAFLYAVLTYAIATAANRLRRNHRRRLGRCAHCAYPLDDLPACPECGHTLSY